MLALYNENIYSVKKIGYGQLVQPILIGSVRLVPLLLIVFGMFLSRAQSITVISTTILARLEQLSNFRFRTFIVITKNRDKISVFLLIRYLFVCIVFVLLALLFIETLVFELPRRLIV